MALNFKFILVAAGVCFTTLLNAQTIHTAAGNSTSTYSGDGGPATAAGLAAPQGVTFDAAGNMYIADFNDRRIRKVSTSGIITTVAGNGTFGFSGDGGPATLAQLGGTSDVAVDGAGNIYIADKVNERIRRVNTSGIITTICGSTVGFGGDGGPATAAYLHTPYGVTTDAAGNVYIADGENYRIRKINTSGIITTVAGNGGASYWGDGGQATAAGIDLPCKVAIDPIGRLYISENGSRRIRRVDTSGIITTYAGTGVVGFSGDGGPATAAQLRPTFGITLDGVGNLYIGDAYNYRVRKIDTFGIISTYAGNGTGGYSGDGGPATAAMISIVSGQLAVKGVNLYMCSGTRVRIVDTINVAPITGTAVVCAGQTTTLSCITTGGTWSSASTSIATVGTGTGVVAGVAGGTAVISYTVAGSTVTRTITVNALPTITASASLGCGGTYTLTAGGGLTYSWSPATGLSCTTCGITYVDPSVTMVYTLTGTNGSGCVNTSTVTVNGNRISGNITLTGSGSIRVWLVRFNWFDSSILAVDSMLTCLSGGTPYYEFASPAVGSYRIKAHLLGGTAGASGYIPTYGLTSPYWYSADTIVHGTGTDTMGINLIFGTVPAGPGFISGYVVSGAGKGTAGDIGAANMLIYLKDGAGNVLTYTYTDAAGMYSFSGLGLGSYIIYPEEYKYYTTPSLLITLTSSSTSSSAIGFRQSTTLGTIKPFVVTGVHPLTVSNNIEVYPNPSTGELSVTGITEEVSYRIFSVTGTAVHTGSLAQGGASISVADLQAGIYILEITGRQSGRSIIRIAKQ